MKKFWLLLMSAIIITSLTGCITVRKVVRERVDQDVSGNQGYLVGGSDISHEPMPVDREYFDIRVEIPTWQEITAPAVRYEDNKTVPAAETKEYQEIHAGNKGYISGRKPPKATTVYEYDDYEVDIYDDQGDIFIYEEKVVKPVYQEYTVKQGDTLSHIAKAFYNKPSKWTIIYEANSDKIKDPSRVKAGTKLRIPDLGEAESRYVK